MLICIWYSCICYLCIKIYKATGNSNHIILPHKTAMALSEDLREGTINLKQSSGIQRQRSKTQAVMRKWHEPWNESRWKRRKEQGRGEPRCVVKVKTLFPAPPGRTLKDFSRENESGCHLPRLHILSLLFTAWQLNFAPCVEADCSVCLPGPLCWEGFWSCIQAWREQGSSTNNICCGYKTGRGWLPNAFLPLCT